MSAVTSSEQFDRFKEKLSFWKFLLGTMCLGVATTVVNCQFQDRQVKMEELRLKHQIDMQEAAAEAKYLLQFLPNATDQDIRVRKSVAEYIMTIAPSKNTKDCWSKYYDRLTQVEKQKEKDESAKAGEIDKTLEELRQLASAPGTAKLDQSDSLRKKLREDRVDHQLLVQDLDKRKSEHLATTDSWNEFSYLDLVSQSKNAEAMGNFEAQKQLLTKAKETAPRLYLPDVLARLAEVCRRLKQYPEALRSMEQAVAISGETPDSLTNLAIYQKNAGKLPDALHSLDRALELDGGQPMTKLVRAGYLIQNKDRAAGESAYEAIRSEVEPNPDFHVNVAWYYAVKGDENQFYKFLESALINRQEEALLWVDEEVDLNRYRGQERFTKLIKKFRPVAKG
jgi:Flp pilus assembly protein TadD